MKLVAFLGSVVFFYVLHQTADETVSKSSRGETAGFALTEVQKYDYRRF